MKITETTPDGRILTAEIPSREEWEQLEEYSTEWWLHLRRYDLKRYFEETDKQNVGSHYRS